jgi:orotidine-5'-phosphate decarboxylase
MNGRDRIIVALDLPNLVSCRDLLDRLGPEARIVKIGSVLFSSEGPPVLQLASSRGLKVFLDLKFHDIPNTVAGAVAAVSRIAPLAFLTVHASGGGEMIRAARKAVDESPNQEKPKILAVTVLTSLSGEQLKEIGFGTDEPQQAVERLAKLAVEAGADGIVCSPKEVAHLRRVLPSGVKLVIPGIRPGNAVKDDQERTAAAGEAVRAGADYLVVGRPITAAKDPRAAFLDLVKEVES